MKNKLGLVLGLGLVIIPSVALTSCDFGGSSSSDLRITISNDSLKKISKYKESEDSSKEVYTIFVNVSNDSSSAVTLKNTDFKVSVNGKESSALYFVGNTKVSIENGVKNAYIVDKSETYSVKVNEQTGESTYSTSSFTLAFEEEITATSTFFYKGSQIATY